jgi:hypothetical protein
MKKLLAFALILGIGTFGALGCTEPKPKEKPKDKPPAGATEKPGEKAVTPPPAVPPK